MTSLVLLFVLRLRSRNAPARFLLQSPCQPALPLLHDADLAGFGRPQVIPQLQEIILLDSGAVAMNSDDPMIWKSTQKVRDVKNIQKLLELKELPTDNGQNLHPGLQ